MKFVFIAILLAFSTVSIAECNRPPTPDLPDGDTSDLAAMVEGQKAVKSYVAATEVYLDCLTAEAEASADGETPEEQTERVEMHNAVVDDMEAVAGEFNEEIREYKAKAK